MSSLAQPSSKTAEKHCHPSRALADLNPQQQAIVQHKDGPALVIAGAGSGKTRVITHRVAHLLNQGVPASGLMMLTFTNKAAREMLQRARDLMTPAGGGLEEENPAARITGGTFHSTANRFLRMHADLLGYQRNYTILDGADARELVRAAAADKLGEKPAFASGVRFPKTDAMLDLFSRSFNRHISLEKQLREENSQWLEFEEDLHVIRQNYRERKKASNSMDFDDLLANWHQLLQSHGETLELARRIRYILVDEYQDTNYIQGEILSLLAKPHYNLMAVGDDAQSIYSWRGAAFENILHFPQRYQAKVYPLEQNYRSTPQILQLANHSIAHNRTQFEKQLRPSLSAGTLPAIIQAYDVHQEAEYLVNKLRSYLAEDIPLSQIGVLYRGHAQSAALQTLLAQHHIPFVVRSGLKFFEQAHIKDALCFLKVLHNPLDEVAWLRLLRMLPGVGAVAAGRIYGVFVQQQAVRITPANQALQKAIPPKARSRWQQLASTFTALQHAHPHPGQMLQHALEYFYTDLLTERFDNPRERESDLSYLVDFAMGYPDLEHLLSQLALSQEVAEAQKDRHLSEPEDSLVLSSVHQAKGLEWDVVFIIGLADGKFPHVRCLEPESKLEEERRVFYVALTRCRRHLHLSVPLMSYTGGRADISRPSRFLAELPPELSHKITLELVQQLSQQLPQQDDFVVEYE